MELGLCCLDPFHDDEKKHILNQLVIKDRCHDHEEDLANFVHQTEASPPSSPIHLSPDASFTGHGSVLSQPCTRVLQRDAQRPSSPVAGVGMSTSLVVANICKVGGASVVHPTTAATVQPGEVST